MASSRISLRLSPKQREQIRAAIGRDAETLELSVEELEQCIAPITMPSPPGPVPVPYPNIG